VARTETAEVFARVDDRPVEPAELLARVGGEDDGAEVLFVGTVRRRNRGRTVTSLVYEVYDEMAVAELRRIGAEAVEEFGLSRVAVRHRSGALKPGEVSVAVAVAAPHREPCYEASRYVMHELKRRLPIWKREAYADGSSQWLDGHRPGPGDDEGDETGAAGTAPGTAPAAGEGTEPA
jgi:molybdopterin synthase catalytic subunit